MDFSDLVIAFICKDTNKVIEENDEEKWTSHTALNNSFLYPFHTWLGITCIYIIPSKYRQSLLIVCRKSVQGST